MSEQPANCLIVDDVYFAWARRGYDAIDDRNYNLGDEFGLFSTEHEYGKKAVIRLNKNSPTTIQIAVPATRMTAACTQSEEHRRAGLPELPPPGFGWTAQVLRDHSQWWFMPLTIGATYSGIVSGKNIPAHKGHLVHFLYRAKFVRHAGNWMGVTLVGLHGSGWEAFTLGTDKFCEEDE